MLRIQPAAATLQPLNHQNPRPQVCQNAQKRNDYRTKTAPFDLVMSHIFSDNCLEILEIDEIIGASGAEGSGEGA